MEKIVTVNNHTPKGVMKAANAIMPNNNGNTHFSVMFFRHAYEIEDTKDKSFRYCGAHRTNNWHEALTCYSETPCPASQLIEGKSWDEIDKLEAEMKQHFKDEKWLDENIYPYL